MPIPIPDHRQEGLDDRRKGLFPWATPEQDSRTHQRYSDEGISLEERERDERSRRR